LQTVCAVIPEKNSKYFPLYRGVAGGAASVFKIKNNPRLIDETA